jgi:hypothetical protein
VPPPAPVASWLELISTDTRRPTSVPQWPQKGRPAVVGLAQRGHVIMPSETRVGGTIWFG